MQWHEDQTYGKTAKVISRKNNMVYECVEHFPEASYEFGTHINCPDGDSLYFDTGRYKWKKLYPATEDNIHLQYYGIMTEFVSETKVKAIIFDKPHAFFGTTTTAKWSLGSWYKEEGYPSLVTLHDARLVFSGYKKRPAHIDFSEIITTKDFRETGFKLVDGNGRTQKNSAISLSMDFGSGTEEKIQWMEGFNHKFLIGTDVNEWELGPASHNDVFSPLSFGFHCISSYGSAKINPVRIGRSLIFVQRTGGIVRELKVIPSNVYKAIDITQYASHLTEGAERGIKHIAYQKNPHSILWAVTHDGRLLGCTVDLDNSVFGWHVHSMADNDADSVQYAINMVTDYTDSEGNDGIILGASTPSEAGTLPQLMKMSSFNRDSGQDVDFHESEHESQYLSSAELPRLDEALDPVYVGGKRRLVSAKIRVQNTQNLLCQTADSPPVKAQIDNPNGLCLAEATLNTGYGRDEGLCISQNDKHGGTILQVLTISELQSVQ